MSDHQIKINRAYKLSSIGRYAGTANAMWDHIPQQLVEQLTGKQLATVMDALYACAAASKAREAREICENGIVWDARKNRSREIAA